jgi:hypothetical protein
VWLSSFWLTSSFRIDCNRLENHSNAMTLIGLVLSWSTINAEQKAVKAGSIKLETNVTGIF